MIDASNLTLSDMGTMNHGMGGGFQEAGGFQDGRDRFSGGENGFPGEMSPPDGIGENAEFPGRRDDGTKMERPGGEDFQGNMPDMMPAPASQASGGVGVLVVSAVVLLLGLLVAFKYKR